jgi:hypothetical protein
MTSPARSQTAPASSWRRSKVKMMRRRINDEREIASLNRALLQGLDLYLKERNFMFKCNKHDTPIASAEAFQKAINAAIDAAQAGHVSLPSIIQTLQNTITNLKYCEAVGGVSSYHYKVEAPPSPRTFEKLVDFIKNH